MAEGGIKASTIEHDIVEKCGGKNRKLHDIINDRWDFKYTESMGVLENDIYLNR